MRSVETLGLQNPLKRISFRRIIFLEVTAQPGLVTQSFTGHFTEKCGEKGIFVVFSVNPCAFSVVLCVQTRMA